MQFEIQSGLNIVNVIIILKDKRKSYSTPSQLRGSRYYSPPAL